MPLVDIILCGRKYSLSCETGQEARLQELADYVGGRLKELGDGGINGSDAYMLVMTTILLADELFDVQDSLEKARAQGGSGGGTTAAPVSEQAIAAIENVTRRIEALAAKVERS